MAPNTGRLRARLGSVADHSSLPQIKSHHLTDANIMGADQVVCYKNIADKLLTPKDIKKIGFKLLFDMHNCTFNEVSDG